MLNREQFEQRLAELPLLSFLWIRSGQLVFSERVRSICERECPMYNTTWACPPAVGSVEQCREKCLSYPDALVICTITEVSDIADITQTLATRQPHEKLTRRIEKMLLAEGVETMVLSTEACTRCKQCTWPDQPCRHADKMYPCIESHGILATELAEQCGVPFLNGNLVTWFSILFYR